VNATSLCAAKVCNAALAGQHYGNQEATPLPAAGAACCRNKRLKADRGDKNKKNAPIAR